MDRAIFDLNSSMEATSLYILLCALLDSGAIPTLNLARARWNGDEESLKKAAEELIQRGVLENRPPISDDKPLTINPSCKWRST
ncbi:MAG: hypothetical protein AB2L11_12150 [Syntrophobacteraceae bacterium]